MEWLFLTDSAVVNELRGRCRRERLRQNLTQAELADRAGLGVATVRRFERDDDTSPGLDVFVRILRVLGALEALDAILPEQPLDPLDPAASERQRAGRTTPASRDGWVWGDEP